MADKSRVGDYVSLQRGTTYKGTLVGKPGPALLGLGSIRPGGGFRDGDYKTYGGECPPNLMLFPGDLFVSLKGATKDGKMIGSIARVPSAVPSGRLTQDTVKLIFHASDQDTTTFLYWLLRTPQYRKYCAARATGSAVVALSRDDFLAYPVPPITPARMHLAKLFDVLDDKIELNRRVNKTLEEIARALFTSWFVDFNPVRAKAGGCDPGLPEPLADLFPDSFKESELGKIPNGWRTDKLGDVLSVIETGGRPKGGVRDVTEGVPSVGAESIVSIGHFDYGKTRFVPREFFEGMKKGHVQHLDVLLYKDGGRPGVYEPHLTRIIREFGDKRSLLCYKHVD